MMSPLKIAVIVATKNRCELLISRTLKALQSQTRKPCYLIICDDSDHEYRNKNREAISQFNSLDCKILYLENHRTLGASGAWNSAVNALLTEESNPSEVALAFLDDDDTWSPEYLECCSNAMETQCLDMVACGINRIEGKSTDSIQNPAPEKLSRSAFLVGNPGIQGSNLFLRLNTFLEAGGFDESLNSSTDRDLCIRLADMNTIRYQAIPMYLVNHYAESDRVRLSTPGTGPKSSGLTAFWRKYHSRMFAEQRRAFTQRAFDLFNWESSSADGSDLLAETSNKALVLVFRNGINSEQLEILELFFKHFLNLDLVGLDVVFLSKAEDLAQHHISTTLRELGIGCFPVESAELLRIYSNRISELRPGSKAWELGTLLESDLRLFNSSEDYLMESGALDLSDHAEPEHLATNGINQHIHELRITSAEHRVAQHFKPKSLRRLGYGSEAIVFTDGLTVFKCIDYWKTRTPKAQFEFLCNSGPTWKNTSGLYPLLSVVRDGSWVLITYPYEISKPYNGGAEELLIQLINGCTQAGIVCNNIHPKNLIQTDKEVKLIDYGSDIRPWTELGFEHMARRTYLTCWCADRPDLNALMRQSLTDERIPELDGYPAFRAKLDYPVHTQVRCESALLSAPKAEPFELAIGVITANPLMLLPLISSLRVLIGHTSIRSLSISVLCNGCDEHELQQLFDSTSWQIPRLNLISEKRQSHDVCNGHFGEEIKFRPVGQVGIALARTMLQRYLGEELEQSPGAIGWILDDDMRLDHRAYDYIGWLPHFRKQGVDVLLGTYEGSSPNPPLNGLRVQLMDLAHNLEWLAKLPDESILPDRSAENALLRANFPDYYYDLSRRHTAHLESPIWLEPSYEYETVREARARLIAGAEGVLNGTPITRSIIATECRDPLKEAKYSVNRGGCTFILNHKAVQHTPNLILTMHGKEARRSDMIWAIVNRYYRGMTIKAVSFPIKHVGRISDKPSVNAEKVQSEIVGSALYAGLTNFLQANPEHQLSFRPEEVQIIHEMTIEQMVDRMNALKQSFYRIKGLVKTLKFSSSGKELLPLTSCLEEEFSLVTYSKISRAVREIGKNDISHFLSQLVQATDAYRNALVTNYGSSAGLESKRENDGLLETTSETTD
ncbi:glycosyltransferase family 2 protein [Vibrio rhodolitus]|uniref:glycosyltransferase family 2 protein n=1 Tax=Vibrio rhodolitus TaxID=2231649 RepID=UPI000E0B0220|nr:glycosyltransferase family A protein [Vibrio rhodolitus]